MEQDGDEEAEIDFSNAGDDYRAHLTREPNS